jgi:hypothetical protein
MVWPTIDVYSALSHLTSVSVCRMITPHVGFTPSRKHVSRWYYMRTPNERQLPASLGLLLHLHLHLYKTQVRYLSRSQMITIVHFPYPVLFPPLGHSSKQSLQSDHMSLMLDPGLTHILRSIMHSLNFQQHLLIRKMTVFKGNRVDCRLLVLSFSLRFKS